MMFEKSKMGVLCLLTALVLTGGIACSDSDDGSGDDDEGTSGAPMGDGDGDAMMDGTPAGDGDTSTGMPGGDTGTGTMPPGTGLPPAPTCDSTIPTTASCGGVDCPGGGMFAQFTCTVPCCADGDVCGTRTAVEGQVSDCAAGAVEDPSCPGYSGMLMGMAVELPGCCTDEGVCGAISSLSNSCITSSMILTDLAPGPACDGSGSGGDADGGI